MGARREAQAALEIDPANAGAMIVLAADRLARGDAEGALLILEPCALTLARQDVGVHLFKIQDIGANGKPAADRARIAKDSIELDPQEPAFRKQLVKYLPRHKSAWMMRRRNFAL